MSLSRNVYDFLHESGQDISYDEVKTIVGALSNSDYQELTYAMADSNVDLIVFIFAAYQEKR